MRLLLRLIGTMCLAICVVFAVGDIARSLAAETTRLLTVSEALILIGASLPTAPDSATLAVVTSEVGRWPVAITTGVAGLVLLVLGRTPRSRRRQSLR
ncbi:hypothetical protein VQ042_10955 [Aurantimonas sp. A2-1-M11]|uniref:hypothetical protein n=1 Tax=Aurantimonas sp. A2-1-M11 TaxID=3113712 RepID=UPI002F93EFD0